jgi:RNA polymerase sigma-70 factor (ECF subfamily)
MGRDTSWTIILAAANGDASAREDFARIYLPVVRESLGVLWRGKAMVDQIDDSVQLVFVQCFQDGGVLERVDPSRSGGFRAFFYGVIKRVARRAEVDRTTLHKRAPLTTLDPEQVANDEATLSSALDRSWAKALIKEAWELHRKRASEQSDAHVQRALLLHLRFEENLPIREIAQLWNHDPVQVHRDYAKARKEFKTTLRDVVGLNEGCSEEELAERCEELLLLLG